MLSFTTCPYCIKAKAILDEKGAKYTLWSWIRSSTGKQYTWRWERCSGGFQFLLFESRNNSLGVIMMVLWKA
eukprot:CCRYP_001469-RA/>CCRYP_001469-RA protein AED:0.11 eAED:0.11 QI:0/-1/0/1/-1/0/1/0/71